MQSLRSSSREEVYIFKMMQTSESFVKVDMIGVLNQCIESFIVDTFGADRWAKILAKSGVQYPWVSTCPYSDKITYTLAITAAEVLGIKLNEALEVKILPCMATPVDTGALSMVFHRHWGCILSPLSLSKATRNC